MTKTEKQKLDDKIKFFYVSAKCVKLINVDGSEDDDEPTSNTPKFDSGAPDSNYASEHFVEKNGKKYKPTHVTISTVIPAPLGRFIPSMMEKHIKDMAKCEEVCIQFVREMSKDEFEADVRFREEQKELEENGPPLDNATQSALDDLIERAAKGELNAQVDPTKSNKVEKPYNPLSDDLSDLWDN